MLTNGEGSSASSHDSFPETIWPIALFQSSGKYLAPGPMGSKMMNTYFHQALAVCLLLNVGCPFERDWPNAREFEGSLRCGMTVSDVRLLAERLGARKFAAPELSGRADVPDYFVSERDRLVSLWFDENGRLTAYATAITSMDHEVEGQPELVKLCPNATMTQ